MKNTIIAIIIFLLILAVWFVFSQFSLFTTCEDFEDKLDRMYTLILDDDFETAGIIMNELKEKWAKTEKVWVFFVHQEDVDTIKTSVSKLLIDIRLENKAYTLDEIENLLYTLRIIRGNESFQLDNVF